MEDVADELTRFLEMSPCPYARRARIQRADPWPDIDAADQKLNALAAALREGDASDHPPDLTLIEIHHADELRLVADASRVIRTLLYGLSVRDRVLTTSVLEGADNPDWDFKFNGNPYFVSLFAPFYPPDHSRWSGSEAVAFVLLQPERGFRRFGVSARRPSRRELSHQVHEIFNQRGQDYELGPHLNQPKSHRYVKPLAGDAPVRWWEDG
jgi:FPC/CPF motif-containing protein YcgG